MSAHNGRPTTHTVSRAGSTGSIARQATDVGDEARPPLLAVGKVLLAAPRSFCAGVEMAIKALAWMVRIYGPPVYCCHEIVHNRGVVERFERLGVVFVDKVDEVPEGSPLILSAHGSAPQVVEDARAMGRIVVNAACPLVTQVHQGVKVRAGKGYTVIYAGQEGHQEAIGTMAVAPEAVRLVENAADVAALTDVDGPVAFLTQTTLSLDDWQGVLDTTRERFPDVWVPEHRDLCFATTNRQSAVRKIADRCDAFIVIGSAKSSNTQALVKTAQSAGCPRVVRVDGPAELPADLTGTIGVTAGASAPEDLVRNVLERLAPTGGVEEVTVTEEDEYFPPPSALRELLQSIELAPEATAMLANDRVVSAGDVLDALAPSLGRPSMRGPHRTVKGTTEDAVKALLFRYAVQVESEMVTVVTEEVDDAWMRGAISYHLGWADADFRPLSDETRRPGGKKLRPALAVLAYQGALAGRHHGNGNAGDADHLDIDAVLPFAAALELFHNYTLVHDDFQDGDRYRRGRPTLWTICGGSQAVNVGNCLHALALTCLERSRTRGADDAVVAELTGALARTSIEVTIGQTRDLAFESEFDVEPDRYLEMIAGKTAALIRRATSGGALLAVGTSSPAAADLVQAYADFGLQLGLAFQIRDDVLGIWGLEAKTGKPAGRDIRRKKKTLPVVFAFRQVPRTVAERLRSLYSQPDELTADQEAEVRAVLDTCDARGFAEAQAALHRDRAIGALTRAARFPESLRDGPYLSDLVAITEFATQRKS